MQRYRVNLRLLISLFVTSLAIIVGAFFLWKWQVNRKATWFRDSARELVAKGDKAEAFDMLFKYVQLRRDEEEPRVELAKIGLELLQDSSTDPERQRQAYGFLQETVRRTGNAELRLELAKFMQGGRPNESLVQVEELLRDDPSNPELLEMLAQLTSRVKSKKEAITLCYRLVGYDQNEDKFDPAKASAKNRPTVYALLANLILENDRDDQDLADRVIEQMIEQNPESADAHLKHSMYLRIVDKKDEANAELAKAYELDPEDLGVLRQKAAVAYEEKDFEAAEEIMRTAIEKHPDEPTLYVFLATVLIEQQRYADGLEVLKTGEEQLGSSKALIFVQLRLNTLFAQEDYAGVQKELDRIERMHIAGLDPLVRFNKARILWQQQKWADAAKAFEAVRGDLLNFPDEHRMCGAMLASCYEKQGKYDLAKQIYEQVVDRYPNYEFAKQALAVVKSKLNISDDSQGRDLETAIREMAALPEAEQNWDPIYTQAEELAKSRDLPESRLLLLKTQIEIVRGRFEEARELIKKAAKADPDNQEVYFVAIALLMNEPNGAELAYERLNRLEEKFGDTARVRVTRAGVLKQLNPPDVVEKLEALTENMDAFSENEKAQVEQGVAINLEQLGHLDEANVHWERSSALSTSKLPIYMHVFEVAFRSRDFPGMIDAEQKVLELVGSKDDANYILCHVQRKMMEYSMQKAEREELVEARQMLDVAIKSRPEWADLHVLYGQVLLVLEEDTDIALRHLDDALKYGPANSAALGVQVKILALQGKLEQAYEKLQRIPVGVRTQVLGRTEADVLLVSGEKEKAFRSAQELAKQEPQNPATQTWFADIAMRTEHLDEAANALEAAAELQSRDADIWLKLISVYAQQRDDAAIEKALRQAQLNIEADVLPLFTAKKYELIGDWQSAEKIYEAAFANRLDELPIARQMAEFYLLRAKAGKVSADRANKYINLILEQAYDGKAERNDPTVAWARDKAARILAASGEYQRFLQAERLLNPDDDTSKLSLSDRALLAEIYSKRLEPESQLKAMKLLTSMHEQKEISKAGVLELGKLLSRSDNWDRAQQLLLDAIAKYNDDEQLMATFIDLQIERGEYSTANTRLNRFRSVHPKSLSIVPLTVKLASRMRNQARLQEILGSIVPPLDRAPSKKQLETALSMARLLTENNQTEEAAKLYEFYNKFDSSRLAEYTMFLARHGDPEKAMEFIRRQFPDNLEEMSRLALGMLRERRPELGERYDEEIEEMVARTLRDDSEAISRLMMQAEFWEITGQYEKATDLYDKILARNDLNQVARAAAMNNLGFLLALQKVRMDEAEELITKSIEIYGPVSDILDTRAVVRMANKNFDGAAQDAELATTFSDDPVKYYHSAQANMLAGNTQAALKAWDRSLALGIEKAKVPKAEQSEFDQVRDQIEGLRTQSAGL